MALAECTQLAAEQNGLRAARRAAVILAAKIRALADGRFAPSFDDVRRVAAPALRHRVLLNFEGEAEGVSTDTILGEILTALPEVK